MNDYDPMERMKEIEIFGVPALFTDKAIPPEAVYPGMSRYELLAGDGDPERPRYAATQSGGKFLGTVLSEKSPSANWKSRSGAFMSWIPSYRGFTRIMLWAS